MEIHLTEKAVRQFHWIFEKNGDPEAVLKIGVRNGGCSGMSYTMDLVKVTGGEYVTQDMGDFKLILDPDDEPYIDGLTIDYNDSILNSGFQFANPKADETCGCGTSFSVAGVDKKAESSAAKPS